jgi:hypothetical protein
MDSSGRFYRAQLLIQLLMRGDRQANLCRGIE